MEVYQNLTAWADENLTRDQLNKVRLRPGEDGGHYIDAWPDELGKPPAPEEVAAWTPTPPDPDKAPAPSLEIGDYKALDAALEVATTVNQVKGIFRQYLRKRAGL